MKQTDIQSHRRFLKASSILGAAAALNPAAIRSAFANSNITPEEESMTATIAVPDSSTLETHNGAIRPFPRGQRCWAFGANLCCASRPRQSQAGE